MNQSTYSVTTTKHSYPIPYDEKTWASSHVTCNGAATAVATFCEEEMTVNPVKPSLTTKTVVFEEGPRAHERMLVHASDKDVLDTSAPSIIDLICMHKARLDTGHIVSVVIESFDHLSKRTIPLYTLTVSNHDALHARQTGWRF